MFTKDKISKMKETEFQNTVLIPLFRAMNFNDVTAFGGGSLELGKDIVMWKEGDVGERVNYGVVVKAVRITGKAKGKDSASEVLNQIRQCLTSEYPDPVTSQKQIVQRCFIVSSQIIEKSAINSIESQLRGFHFDKLLTWIHPGTNLHELIRKYLPLQNVFEKLSSVQKELDDSMKNVPYRFIANSDSQFTLVGKHEKAFEELPLIVPFKLKFDTKTQDGKEALEKWQNHLKKGVPVEIDGKYIESFELPDFLPPFLKPQLNKDSKLFLKHNPIEKTIPIKLHFTSLDGQVSELDYIELRLTQPGEEETTFSNEHQSVPWRVRMTLNSISHKATFNYSHQLEESNVFQQLKCLEFLQCLEKGGNLQIENLVTGIKVPNANFPETKKKSVSVPYIQLLKDLINIQNKTLTLFSISKEGVSEQEAREIFGISEIVEKGELKIPFDSIITHYSIKNAKEIIASYKQNNYVKLIHKIITPEIEILGNKINLGQIVLYSNAYLINPQLREIEKKISEGQDSESVEMEFKFQDEITTAYYINWLSPEKLEELKNNTIPEIFQENDFNTWIVPATKDNVEQISQTQN